MKVIHGFREPQDLLETFSDGEGAWLIAKSGKRFLDFSSQYWNVNLGHRNPRLIDCIARGAREHLFINHRFGEVESASILATKIDSITGQKFSGIQYMASGSMAVETAIKVAREFTGRPEILSFRKSYHGMSMGALSATGYDELVNPFGGRDPRHLLCGTFDLEDTLTILETRKKSIAALVAEPVISNQVITPSADFWKKVSEACRDLGILLIADEVVSGIGRCGDWLGCFKLGMNPDLVALGKGISGGMVPFAALLYTDRLAKFYDGRTMLHGQTFDGYDLGARIALEVIQTIELEGLLEKARRDGELLQGKFVAMCETQEVDAQVRGWGMLRGIELSNSVIADHLLHPFTVELQKDLIEEGLLMGGLGRVLIAAPPLIVSKEEIDDGVARLERALGKTLSARNWLRS